MRTIVRTLLPLAALSPGLARAATDSGDTAWILTSTALVLFMTLPGLALFYGGLVRVRNVLSVLVQCFAITCVATMLWLICVYSLAFGEGNGWIGDLSKVMFSGVLEDSEAGTIPESLFALFQLTFAVITPALIVGGFAERMRFSAVLLFTALWLLVVYAPITHWVWGGGWLGEMGLLDFAGGTVVHVTAGVAALVAALVLGSRRGFPTTAMPPHNMTMTVTGAGMLWVGWFGFNGGSALAANGDAAMAMLVTHISASAGAFSWMCAEWVRYGKPSGLGIVTGMVAGLGTITPASGFVGPAGALVIGVSAGLVCFAATNYLKRVLRIGVSAGLVCFAATNYLKRVLRIDDSLDVFPVHGVGGILGTLLAGVFASDALGVFSGQGLAEGVGIGEQVGVQAIGVLATGAWTALATFVLLKLVDAITGLRVDDEHETEGLDTATHNERGYIL